MPDDVAKLEFRPGDILTAESLQAIVRLLQRPGGVVRGGAGILAHQAGDGSLQISGTTREKFHAVTTSTITAMSGTTYGKGTVTVEVGVEGGTNDMTATTTDLTLTVYYMSTTTGGVASGVRVQIEQFSDGNYYITAVDCAN